MIARLNELDLKHQYIFKEPAISEDQVKELIGSDSFQNDFAVASLDLAELFLNRAVELSKEKDS